MKHWQVTMCAATLLVVSLLLLDIVNQNIRADQEASKQKAIDAANAKLSQELMDKSNRGLRALNAALKSQPTGVYNLNNIEQQAWKNAPTTHPATTLPATAPAATAP